MTLIIDNEGDLVLLRLVIDHRQEVFREGNRVFHLLLEDAVVVEAAVVAGEATSTVLAGGKHYALLHNFHLQGVYFCILHFRRRGQDITSLLYCI
jgi:hypothetical protein